MGIKKNFKLCFAVIAMVCLAQVAFAANVVDVNMNKKIVPRSSCEQAGSIALSFDDQTIMHEGDQINFLLNNNATVCGNVDFYLKLTDTNKGVGGGNDATGIGDDANQPVRTTQGNNDNFIVTFNGVAQADDSGIFTDTNYGDGSKVDFGFRVQATDGSQFVYMTLGWRALAALTNPTKAIYTFTADSSSSNTIKYNMDPNNQASKLIVQFFDEATNSMYLWEEANGSSAPNVYDDDIGDAGDEADNVLCLNLSNTGSATTVSAIPESKPLNSNYQLTFVGDYIITQIVSTVSYKVEAACKDNTCLEVAVVSGVDQELNSVAASGQFDFGDYTSGTCTDATADRWTSSGYCNSSSGALGNGILFYKDGSSFDQNDEFRVTMTLLVGTTQDYNYARFSATDVESAFYTGGSKSSSNANCSCSMTGISSSTSGASVTYVQAGGNNWNWYNPSSVATKNQTSKTAVFQINSEAQAAKGGILIDLDPVQLGIGKVSVGEKVYLNVNVQKLPCGTVASANICLAELISTCTDPASLAQLTFPFVTPASPDTSVDPFWSGICITNTSSDSVTVQLVFYDTEGGMGTFTDTLAAQGMIRTTFGAMVADTTKWTDGTTALNPQKYAFMRALSSKASSIDGAIFVGDTAGTYIHGYLPRK